MGQSDQFTAAKLFLSTVVYLASWPPSARLTGRHTLDVSVQNSSTCLRLPASFDFFAVWGPRACSCSSVCPHLSAVYLPEHTVPLNRLIVCPPRSADCKHAVNHHVQTDQRLKAYAKPLLLLWVTSDLRSRLWRSQQY